MWINVNPTTYKQGLKGKEDKLRRRQEKLGACEAAIKR
jgi:hypothetical protein